MDNKEIRKVLGTLPGEPQETSYEIVKGCERLKVVEVSSPVNPYKMIVEAALQTWGIEEGAENLKWDNISPEARLQVAIAALSGNTLPQALEGPTFQFKVSGTPRHCFDQFARARIGFSFFSIGVRDNDCRDRYLIVHPKEYNNPELMKLLQPWWRATKDLYVGMISERRHSWQNSRDILPMGMSHQFGFAANLLALKGVLSRRLAFCEAHHIVGMSWLIRKRIEEKFPLIANWIRPACDFAHKCFYQKSYYLSNAFGMLFSSCGRNPAPTPELKPEFNESGADLEEMEKELGFKIPQPDSWLEIDDFKPAFEDINNYPFTSDKVLFL